MVSGVQLRGWAAQLGMVERASIVHNAFGAVSMRVNHVLTPAGRTVVLLLNEIHELRSFSNYSPTVFAYGTMNLFHSMIFLGLYFIIRLIIISATLFLTELVILKII